jgi:hypothetical protein
MREQPGVPRSLPARTRQQPRIVRTDDVAVEAYEDEEQEVYTRPPSSVRRYQPAPKSVSPATRSRDGQPGRRITYPHSRDHVHRCNRHDPARTG